MLRLLKLSFYFFLILNIFPNISYGDDAPKILGGVESTLEKTREEDLITKIGNDGKVILDQFLNKDLLNRLFPAATHYGEIENELPVVPVYKNNDLIGFMFETYDLTRALGYSRRPFHIIVGLRNDGHINAVRLVHHVEPIAILGRTDDDFHTYLNQYEEIDIKKGVSLTLALTGADIEGETFAMRGTAGDTSALTNVDGVSRTTTSSLLFMDAIMRSSRKVARVKNIDLTDADLGNFIDLELYSPQNWENLLADNSISNLSITVKDIRDQFDKIESIDTPRKYRFKPDSEIFTEIFMALVTPSGIGTNILGRRWYDQYVAAGRNVEDIVLYLGVKGESWRDITKEIDEQESFKTVKIIQDGRDIFLTPFMLKTLPFHHAKEAPDLTDQGLFFLNQSHGLNITEPFDLVFSVKGSQKSDSEIESKSINPYINFNINYSLPSKYIIKVINDEVTTHTSDNLISDRLFTSSLLGVWSQNKTVIIITTLTSLLALVSLVLLKNLAKNRKLHNIYRPLFLLWVLVCLGWIFGSQINIIHLLNIVQWTVEGGSLANFIYEPGIIIIGMISIIAVLFWGRALFCGWLCPFGALQELIAKVARSIGLKEYKVPNKLDRYLRKIKYAVLFILISLLFIDYELAAQLSALEPFKTAITFHFIVPPAPLIWALLILVAGVFVERAYCRFLCPLGAGFAVLGKLRIMNFLKRRTECGNPCKACNPTCPTGAILETGKINMDECFGCLDCQVMYYDDKKCPPLVAMRKQIIT